MLHLRKHRVSQNVGTHVIIHNVIYNALLEKTFGYLLISYLVGKICCLGLTKLNQLHNLFAFESKDRNALCAEF